jgi:hypothetical protein
MIQSLENYYNEDNNNSNNNNNNNIIQSLIMPDSYTPDDVILYEIYKSNIIQPNIIKSSKFMGNFFNPAMVQFPYKNMTLLSWRGLYYHYYYYCYCCCCYYYYDYHYDYYNYYHYYYYYHYHYYHYNNYY